MIFIFSGAQEIVPKKLSKNYQKGGRLRCFEPFEIDRASDGPVGIFRNAVADWITAVMTAHL